MAQNSDLWRATTRQPAQSAGGSPTGGGPATASTASTGATALAAAPGTNPVRAAISVSSWTHDDIMVLFAALNLALAAYTVYTGFNE